MTDLIVSIHDKDIPLENKIRIYGENRKTVIKSDNYLSSLRVDYGLNAGSPIQIVRNKNNKSVKIDNNMSGLLLKCKGSTAQNQESITLMIDEDNSSHIGTVQIIDKNRGEPLTMIDISLLDGRLEDKSIPSAYDSDSNMHYKDVSKILEMSPDADRIGQGQFRDVYRINQGCFDFASEAKDGSIVKIARLERGVKANRSEMQTWQAVKSTDSRPLFCPITSIGPDHTYIIMEKATNIGSLGVEIIDKVSQTVEKSFNADIEKYDGNHPLAMSGWDVKKSNVGIHNGKPVLVDYPYGGKFSIQSQEARDLIEQVLHEQSF